jgi:hypothetical protein
MYKVNLFSNFGYDTFSESVAIIIQYLWVFLSISLSGYQAFHYKNSKSILKSLLIFTVLFIHLLLIGEKEIVRQKPVTTYTYL